MPFKKKKKSTTKEDAPDSYIDEPNEPDLFKEDELGQ